jgi:hypothetical protein
MTTSTADQIRNSIVDNKLLRLTTETIPLTAISSISVDREPVRLFRAIAGGFWAFIFGSVLLSGSSSLDGGAFNIGLFLFIISALAAFSGLKTIFNPQYFLLINLHSGRTVRLDVESRQQSFQADAELQNAILGAASAPVLAVR